MSDDIYAPRLDGDTLVIPIFDVIGGWWGIDPKTILSSLRKHRKAKSIRLEIDSPGGSVFDGITIYNKLRQDGRPIEAHVFGMAASMASVLLLAADSRVMHPGSMVMIHEPWNIAMGGPTEMEKNREFLQKVKDEMVDIYAARTGADPEDLASMMQDETWLVGAEAMENGFATSVIDPADDTDERPEPGTDDAAALGAWNDRRGSLITIFEHAPDSVGFETDLGWHGSEPGQLAAAMAMHGQQGIASFGDAMAAVRGRTRAEKLFTLPDPVAASDLGNQPETETAEAPQETRSIVNIAQLAAFLSLPPTTTKTELCAHLGIGDDATDESISSATMARLAADRSAADEAVATERAAAAAAAAKAEADRVKNEQMLVEAQAAAAAEVERQAGLSALKVEAEAMLAGIASPTLAATYTAMVMVDDPEFKPDPANPAAVAPKIVDAQALAACKGAIAANPSVQKSQYTGTQGQPAAALRAAATAANAGGGPGTPGSSAALQGDSPTTGDPTPVVFTEMNIDIHRTFPKIAEAGLTPADLVKGAEKHNKTLEDERRSGVDRSQFYS